MYIEVITHRRPYVRSKLRQTSALPIGLKIALTPRPAKRGRCKRSVNPSPPILAKYDARPVRDHGVICPKQLSIQVSPPGVEADRYSPADPIPEAQNDQPTAAGKSVSPNSLPERIRHTGLFALPRLALRTILPISGATGNSLLL